jgi:hypothetical protein
MHPVIWAMVGPFIRREVGAMLNAAASVPPPVSVVLQDTAVPHRAGTEWGCA